MIRSLIKRYLLFLIFLLLIHYPLCSTIIESPINNLSIPTLKEFTINTEYIRPFQYKKITIAEYITDPFILYVSLWGCLGLTYPAWEKMTGSSWDSVWEPDKERGFEKIYNFAERCKMEPFGTGRIDPITKEFNGLTVFRGDIYAKNIIEPAYFTLIGLYLRAKNYHPAIMITEIFLLSFLYEFTIRPFYMNASFEQLLKNPSVGIVFSILMDELATFLLTTPYIGLHVLAYIINPFKALPNARIHPLLFFDTYHKAASINAVITF